MVQVQEKRMDAQHTVFKLVNHLERHRNVFHIMYHKKTLKAINIDVVVGCGP
jgi:hypothetical protein